MNWEGENRKVVNLEGCYGDHDELLRRIAIHNSVAAFWRDKAKGLVRGHYDKFLASSHILLESIGSSNRRKRNFLQSLLP